jgi:hypothetical protein
LRKARQETQLEHLPLVRLRGFFSCLILPIIVKAWLMLETIFGEHIRQKIYRAFETIEVVVGNDNISRGH